MTTVVVSWSVLVVAIGQAPPPGAQEGDQRQPRLEYLKQRTAEFALYRGSDGKSPLPLKPEPVSHYSNPLGPSSDGATFLWLDGGRPVAALSLSLRSNPRNAVIRECTSFSATPLECRQK